MNSRPNPFNVLKSLLYPVFEDKEQQHQTTFLNVILSVCFAGSLFLVIVYPLIAPDQKIRSLIILPIPVVTFGLFFLVRRGYFHLSGILLSSIIWLVLTFSVATGGGVRSLAFPVYFLTILISGFLISNRTGAWFALMSILVGLIVAILEVRGGLPSPILYDPIAIWAIYSVIFLITATLLNLAVNSIRRALELAKQNKENLNKQNQQLEQQAKALEKANRAYKMLSYCNQAVVRVEDETNLLQEVCQIIVEVGGYRMAWIGYAEHDEMKRVKPVAQMGYEDGYLETVNITWADSERGRGPTGTAIRSRKPTVVANIFTDPYYLPWREEASKRGYSSGIALPLTVDENILGALNVYSPEPDSFDKAEVELLMKLADDLAFGVMALRTRIEREEQEALYHTLFDNVPLGLGLADSEGRIIAYNQAMMQQGKYTHEDHDLVNNVTSLYYDPEDRERILKRTADQGFLDRAEIQFKRKDGTPYDILLSLRQVVYKGQPHMQAVVEDITEIKKAQEELKAVKQRLEHLLDTSPSVIYSTKPNKDFTPTYVSRNIKEQLGYDVKECLDGTNWWFDRIHPEDKSRIIPELSSLFQVGHHSHEYRFLQKDGKYIWIHDEMRLVHDESGNRQEIVGAWIDITPRKLAEVERQDLLKETQQRAAELATLYDSAKIITSTLELDEVLNLITQQLVKVIDIEGCALSQWDKETDTVVTWIVYRKTEEYLADSPGNTYSLKKYPVTKKVLEKKQIVLINIEDPNADPAEVFLMRSVGVKINLMMPIVKGDEVLGLAELYDSQRKNGFTADEIRLCQALINQAALSIQNAQLLQRTHDQAQQLDQILQTVQEGILLIDKDHCLLIANPMGQQFLAALSHHQLGDNITHLGNRDLNTILDAPPDNRLWHELATDKPRRYFQLTATPLKSSPQIGGWVVTLREVTQEKERQEYLHAQERLATVGQLAAGVAHDFNNIMAVISLYSGLLLRSPDLSSKNRDHLMTIQKQSHRAASLIGQIVDFSRRSVMERSSFELVPFIKELVKLIKRTFPENISIRFEFEEGRYVVSADPTRLQQVMMNLLVNARDAMPDGGNLTIKLTGLQIKSEDERPLPDMTLGEWLKLEILDTGIGIEVEHLPFVFDPFFTTKPVGEGTGLGLAQAYGIIRQHEGYINAVSRVNEGTTITIYLPTLMLKKALPTGLNVDKDLSLTGGGETILLVEDDEATRQALRDTLEELNYQVVVAINGEEALNLFDQNSENIDLVLSDLVMPGIGGEALFKSLQQKGKPIKMVLMTGYPLEEEGRALLEQGIVAWVSKPFSTEKVAETVHRALTA